MTTREDAQRCRCCSQVVALVPAVARPICGACADLYPVYAEPIAPPSEWDEVTQSIPHDPVTGVMGNCLQAVVASVLRLPIDNVPHFSLFAWWPQAMELFVREHGLTCKGERTNVIPDRLCIVGGRSPRGVAHVVVGRYGEVVWDPHPSREGLTEIRDVTWFEEAEAGNVCWFCTHPWCLAQDGAS